MQRTLFLLLLFFLLFSLQTVRGQDFEPDEVIAYKKTAQGELHLHIFYPENHDRTGKVPSIVFFHGGGWNRGHPRQFYPHARYMASRGMVAISAEYRLFTVHGTTPFDCVTDGKSAIRWVKAHARSLGIDPDRIVAGGGSAGGHIAAATATLDGFNETGEDTTISTRAAALVLFNPVVDNSPDGYGYERIGDRYPEFSPMHNIDSNTPPVIFFLGTSDKVISVETARRFKAHMQAQGRRCDLFLYDGQEHGFYVYRDGTNPFYRQTVRETDRFLQSLGLLEGDPTL